MTQRIKTASDANDWRALELADKELAAKLPGLAEPISWTSAERACLQRLRAIHSQAYQHCALESARLKRHLSEMRANKDGWIAYALHNENEVDKGTA